MRRLLHKINRAWLCMEIFIDLVLIIWSIALLAGIQTEFNELLERGGTVYVTADSNYWGPLEIVCPHGSDRSNCDRALQLHATTSGTQNYFSLKYLEFLRENTPITVEDITESRHILFVSLSIYICIWFCCSCAGKLQSNREVVGDGSDGPHYSYYVAMCYLENSLATFKMMMINIFAVSEELEGIFNVF